MDIILEIPLISELETKIANYYGKTAWMDIAREEDGISCVVYRDKYLTTYIEFESEAHKTWFILKWL